MRALTVCFFPDAWIALGGSSDGALIPQSVEQVMSPKRTTCQDVWGDITHSLEAAWQETRSANPDMARWAGSNCVSDWARYATTNIALTGVGKSLRSMERRLKRRTLQSRQSIEFFAKLEGLHARSVANPDASPAELAVDAAFSDQSHMGRSVKRATGFSPKHLNARIAQDEAFWCYRLLGERF